MKVLHWLVGCGLSYSPGARRRYRAVTVHSGIITRRLPEINTVISSGQNTMYDTHPAASPSTVSFSNHFQPTSHPHSLTHSAFFRLPTSATHLQITAALGTRPVISRCNFFSLAPHSPLAGKDGESERQEELGRDSRNGNPERESERRKQTTESQVQEGEGRIWKKKNKK